MTPTRRAQRRRPVLPGDSEAPRLPPRLLDERSDPDFRGWFGRLASQALEVEVAVTRMRLSGIDLSESELSGISSLRVLLGEVNAVLLGAEAAALMADPSRARNLELILELIQDDVIEIRSAPLAGWSPDFTVFYSEQGPHSVLVGPHWFQRPFPHRGPAFASIHGPREARRAAARFSELWSRSHAIGPAIRSILERSRDRRPGGSGPARAEKAHGPTRIKAPQGTENLCESRICAGSDPVDTSRDSG